MVYKQLKHGIGECSMKEFIEKLISRLEEYKYSHLAEHDSESLEHCKEKERDCEGNDCFLCVWDKTIEIVTQLAKEHKECYKPCHECEAYNKEKHYCPKWCKVIKSTVEEIEQNRWISCEEMLPQEGQKVLCSIDGNIAISRYGGEGFWVNGKIEAWMPLPKKYEQKGEK